MKREIQMKCITTPSSILTKYDRWDAEFHIAIGSIVRELELVRRTMDEETIVTILKQIRTEDMEVIDVLSRGSNHPDRRYICKKYPFIAYTLMQNKISDTIAKLRDKIKSDQEYLELLVALESK